MPSAAATAEACSCPLAYIRSTTASARRTGLGAARTEGALSVSAGTLSASGARVHLSADDGEGLMRVVRNWLRKSEESCWGQNSKPGWMWSLYRQGSCVSAVAAADGMEIIVKAFVRLSGLTFSFVSQNKKASTGGGESVDGRIRGGVWFWWLKRALEEDRADEGHFGGRCRGQDGPAERQGVRRLCSGGPEEQGGRRGGQIRAVLQGVEISGDSEVQELNGSGGVAGRGQVVDHNNIYHIEYRIIISSSQNKFKGENIFQGVKTSISPKAEHSQSLSGLQCAKSSNKGLFFSAVKPKSTRYTSGKDTQLPTETVFLSTYWGSHWELFFLFHCWMTTSQGPQGPRLGRRIILGFASAWRRWTNF
ncbi:hypothetical protein VP01_2594g1 [Puccinia sorghi]|uniref:Uncharacterized protein n=1 Tax=Puccinia sorghi TaxID=27349 RepID=A0A0L6V4R0_9BASI|nr:hypothetical protein VP01_2594g1 [Puccinia sorghi]